MPGLRPSEQCIWWFRSLLCPFAICRPYPIHRVTPRSADCSVDALLSGAEEGRCAPRHTQPCQGSSGRFSLLCPLRRTRGWGGEELALGQGVAEPVLLWVVSAGDVLDRKKAHWLVPFLL
nr:unnamed protein product [Rattus norvegicus]